MPARREAKNEWKLLTRIGIGGMAEVFLAERGGARCAVKRVLPHFANDPLFRGLFAEEARVWAALEHPAIVQLLAVTGDDDPAARPALVLEWIDGAPLEALLPAGPFAVAALCAVTATLLDALEYLAEHAPHAPVLHRDVAPSNLLVDRRGVVKLTDFGIAYAAERAIRTHTGELRGRFRVMPPERRAGMPASLQTEFFAVGATLIDLALGAPALKLADAPAPADAQHVPAVLRPFVAALLASDPHERPPSIAAARELWNAARPRPDAAAGARELAARVAAIPPVAARRATPVLE